MFIKILRTIIYFALGITIIVYGLTKATAIFIKQYIQYLYNTIVKQ